jgi:hypothetical protein
LIHSVFPPQGIFFFPGEFFDEVGAGLARQTVGISMDSSGLDDNVNDKFLHDHDPSGIHSGEILLFDNPLDG